MSSSRRTLKMHCLGALAGCLKSQFLTNSFNFIEKLRFVFLENNFFNELSAARFVVGEFSHTHHDESRSNPVASGAPKVRRQGLQRRWRPIPAQSSVLLRLPPQFASLEGCVKIRPFLAKTTQWNSLSSLEHRRKTF